MLMYTLADITGDPESRFQRIAAMDVFSGTQALRAEVDFIFRVVDGVF